MEVTVMMRKMQRVCTGLSNENGDRIALRPGPPTPKTRGEGLPGHRGLGWGSRRNLSTFGILNFCQFPFLPPSHNLCRDAVLTR